MKKGGRPADSALRFTYPFKAERLLLLFFPFIFLLIKGRLSLREFSEAQGALHLSRGTSANAGPLPYRVHVVPFDIPPFLGFGTPSVIGVRCYASVIAFYERIKLKKTIRMQKSL